MQNQTLNVGRILLGTVAVIGLVLAQAIDGVLTASGLQFLDIVLDVPVVGRWGMAIGMAMVLQAVVLCGDMVLSNVGGVRHRGAGGMVLVAIVALMLPVMGFGAVLHYAQLTNLSQGEGLLAGQMQDAATLHTRLIAADQQIGRAYAGAISDLTARAADSVAGHDPTGVASCGPLCRAAQAVQWRLKTGFADLARPVVSDRFAPADAATAFALLHAEIDALRPKSLLFGRMCEARGERCADPIAPILADPAMARLEAALGRGHAASRVSLVMQHIDADVRAVAAGQATSVTVLLFAYVLLLPLSEIMLMLCLRLALAARPARERLATLRRDDVLLDEELALHARVAAKRAFSGAVLQPAE